MSFGTNTIRAILLAALLTAIVGANCFLTKTEDGSKVERSLWGLNLRHYYKFITELSAKSQIDVEENALAAIHRSQSDMPILHPPTGIYDKPLAVSIENATPDKNYRYTTDGKIPTEGDTVFDQDLEVKNTSVLRIKAFGSEAFASEPAVGSYIFGHDSEMTAVSLVVDPIYLFDKHIGIYVKPNERGRAWERPAQISFLNRDTSGALQSPVRLRIHGGTSRNAYLKSFRLIFDANDTPTRHLPSMPGFLVSSRQNEWVLRSAGDGALFRDRLANEVARQMGLLTSPTLPVVLYLNGELWGVYDLMERVNPEFIRGKVKVQKLSLLRGSLANPTEVVGDAESWRDLYAYVQDNDLSDPSVFDEVRRKIDLDNLVDFWIFQIYIADNDRPDSNMNIFRTSDSTDWKFLVWDSDSSFNYHGAFIDHDTLAWNLRDRVRNDLKPFGSPDADWQVESTLLFRQLMQNQSFRIQFHERFRELLSTTFSTENMLQTFDVVLARYDNFSAFEKNRFTYMSAEEGSFEIANQISMIRQFIRERPANIESQLTTEFQ